jgi:hypothetical protein
MLKKQMQAGILAGCMALCGISVMVAAAQEQAVVQNTGVLQAFVLGNQNDVTDPLNPFAGAWFDIRSFMSHPCYEINGTEAQMCRDSYGITTPLKTYMDNGQLMAFVSAHKLFDSEKTIVLASPSDGVTLTSAPMEVSNEQIHAQENADMYQKREDRGNQLWEMCGKMFKDQGEMAGCYQRNIRLIDRFTVDMEGNVH